MIEVMIFDHGVIDEVFDFYQTHAHNDILYPRDSRWMSDHLGIDFFLMGIRINGILIAVAWAAKLKDFVYFTIENESLIIKNDGDYSYSGGWCIRPDQRSKGLFQLLTAAVNLFWFDRINIGKTSMLWGRMVGQKDADGSPLFWNKIGEPETGLSYGDLLKLPFGTMEKVIFMNWPKEPMPLKEISQDVIKQTLGKTFEPLVGPLNQFLKWGWVVLTDRYVPTSLNRFFWSTNYRIPNSRDFYDQALAKVINEFDNT